MKNLTLYRSACLRHGIFWLVVSVILIVIFFWLFVVPVMAGEETMTNTINIKENFTFVIAQPTPNRELIIYQGLEDNEINQIRETYSYDAETARIMVNMAIDENNWGRVLHFIEDLIALDKEKAIELMIKYKIAFVDEKGNRIGYKEIP